MGALSDQENYAMDLIYVDIWAFITQKMLMVPAGLIISIFFVGF